MNPATSHSPKTCIGLGRPTIGVQGYLSAHFSPVTDGPVQGVPGLLPRDSYDRLNPLLTLNGTSGRKLIPLILLLLAIILIIHISITSTKEVVFLVLLSVDTKF